MNTSQNKKLDKLVDGATLSIKEDIAIEEMSELTKAIIKKRRGIEPVSHIAEEIADVMIMCEQLIRMYEIENLVNIYVDRKLDRQIERDKNRKELSRQKDVDEINEHLNRAKEARLNHKRKIIEKHGLESKIVCENSSMESGKVHAPDYSGLSYEEMQKAMIIDNID